MTFSERVLGVGTHPRVHFIIQSPCLGVPDNSSDVVTDAPGGVDPPERWVMLVSRGVLY